MYHDLFQEEKNNCINGAISCDSISWKPMKKDLHTSQTLANSIFSKWSFMICHFLLNDSLTPHFLHCTQCYLTMCNINSTSKGKIKAAGKINFIFPAITLPRLVEQMCKISPASLGVWGTLPFYLGSETKGIAHLAKHWFRFHSPCDGLPTTAT